MQLIVTHIKHFPLSVCKKNSHYRNKKIIPKQRRNKRARKICKFYDTSRQSYHHLGTREMLWWYIPPTDSSNSSSSSNSRQPSWKWLALKSMAVVPFKCRLDIWRGQNGAMRALARFSARRSRSSSKSTHDTIRYVQATRGEVTRVILVLSQRYTWQTMRVTDNTRCANYGRCRSPSIDLPLRLHGIERYRNGRLFAIIRFLRYAANVSDESRTYLP